MNVLYLLLAQSAECEGKKWSSFVELELAWLRAEIAAGAEA